LCCRPSPSAAQIVLLERRAAIAELPERATPPGARMVEDWRDTGCEARESTDSVPVVVRELLAGVVMEPERLASSGSLAVPSGSRLVHGTSAG
jgi:hypothetical protein